jgi:hypothetical protein
MERLYAYTRVNIAADDWEIFSDSGIEVFWPSGFVEEQTIGN